MLLPLDNSFELLDMLKAPVKAIRRATVNTFGYIAKAIGPQDVLVRPRCFSWMTHLEWHVQNRICRSTMIGLSMLFRFVFCSPPLP